VSTLCLKGHITCGHEPKLDPNQKPDHLLAMNPLHWQAGLSLPLHWLVRKGPRLGSTRSWRLLGSPPDRRWGPGRSFQYLCRGRRAVPLQTFTTRHSIRKLFIVMAWSTTFTQFAPETTKFRKITLNKSHFAVQGHSRSPILAPIESSYTTSY